MRERVRSLLVSRRARLALPLLLAALILFSGWTVSNQLAASRQGEWVKVTRGEIASGIDVTGTLASIETSSLHMDVIRDLKRIVAHLTSVAYPILEAGGELSTSRLRTKEEAG